MERSFISQGQLQRFVNYMFNNTFKNKRVLITGHTGFKGSWLAVWLNSLGAKVYGISDKIPTEPSHFHSAGLSNIVTDLRGNISKLDDIKALIEKVNPDVIFHLAAQAIVRKSHNDPIETWSSNLNGTLNILDTLRETNGEVVAIMITSDKCYDNKEWVWGYRETDALGGIDPYSASKAAAELVIKSYVASYFPSGDKVKVASVRAGNVIGGADWAQDRIVPDCIRAWARGESVNLRNPSATRPWQHVLEPLSGYLSLASKLLGSKELHGHAFNFGPSESEVRSVYDLVSEMSKSWSSVKFSHKDSINDTVHESTLLKLNCDKAYHYLNWKATLNFKETVDMTTTWYKNFYSKKLSKEAVLKFSEKQIEDYVSCARDRGAKWVI